ncbi:DUF3606 domain-containing protein [Phenylobacterium sp.]|uniref:DUF3606 domain-containing protein n=1 Tax=Phenylobacterium sp. TaxID=1871053 RepID=UPI002731EFB3|nr:DUF3606 domain-containing protein [Phenylobacterium sp.]MDP1598526.1 DUF3606 domain-containing protein [Phenylobacterium sp.]MDP3592687.1 DUF3606 domain-containing protein [Phenylobacterium sp.]
MADDKNNRGEPDRSRVSGEEPYEVKYFAEKHGLSVAEAEKLIRDHGNDRATLDAAAARLRSS